VTDLTLNVDNTKINRVSCVKFLGILIDENLNWHEQILHCKKKISSGVYAMNTLKQILNTDHLKTLYYSLIHSYLSYGNILWGTARKLHVHKLEILQKRAVRIISKAKYNAHTCPIFKSLHIPQLIDIHNIQLCKMMFQYTNNMLPSPIMQVFVSNSTIHDHNTRNRNVPHMECVHFSQTANSFLHKAPQLWGKLPQHLKNITTENTFNHKIKNYYIHENQV